jgi:hypothetical protein
MRYPPRQHHLVSILGICRIPIVRSVDFKRDIIAFVHLLVSLNVFEISIRSLIGVV